MFAASSLAALSCLLTDRRAAAAAAVASFLDVLPIDRWVPLYHKPASLSPSAARPSRGGQLKTMGERVADMLLQLHVGMTAALDLVPPQTVLTHTFKVVCAA